MKLYPALEAIRDELGVPGDGYPAPVANAARIAREALEEHQDAEFLVAQLREAARELETAHGWLDANEVPRRNPDTGNAFTLAARIAYLGGVR